MNVESSRALVDMHIHCYDELTNRSGVQIKEILNLAKKNNIKYISFTSHNTLDEYEELLKCVSNTDEYDDIQIIIGLEINSSINDEKLRDFLIYMPLESIKGMKKWVDKSTKRDLTSECQQMQLEHFKKIGKELGLVFDDDLTVEEGQYAGRVFAESLKEYAENQEYDKMLAETTDPKFDIIKQMLAKSEICFSDILNRNQNWFFSELVRPADSPFNINAILAKLRPNLEELIRVAHENRALVFVAHPFHLDRTHIKEYLGKCRSFGIDGIESFYLTQIEKFIDDKRFIEEFCKNNNLLYGSGGTDFHTLNGSDYLGIGILGNEEKQYEMAEQEIPTWARDMFISIEKFKQKIQLNDKLTISMQECIENAGRCQEALEIVEQGIFSNEQQQTNDHQFAKGEE